MAGWSGIGRDTIYWKGKIKADSFEGFYIGESGAFFPDNIYLGFGNSYASPDLKIYSDGTRGIIDGRVKFTGAGNATAEPHIYFYQDEVSTSVEIHNTLFSTGNITISDGVLLSTYRVNSFEFPNFDNPVGGLSSSITDAATVYIQGQPLSLTPGIILTNTWALWVDGGSCRFDDTIVLKNGSAASPSMRFFSDTATGLYRVTTNTVGITINGTKEFELSGTKLTIGSATTDRVNFVSGDNGTAPTLAGGAPTFTDYYGGNTNALGDPTEWLTVELGGTTRKIPTYA